MGMPWGYGPKEFTIAAGDNEVIQLNVPYRGTIKAINLQQLDGGADAGVFEIYDSEAPAVALDASSSSSAGGTVVAAQHSITAGEVTITAGVYRANNLDIQYINRDGSPTNGVRRLWMRLNIAAVGPVSFSLGMTIEPPPLNG